MRPLPAFLVLSVALASATEAAPARPVVEQTKIDYLLEEVRNAKATFLRNGREHTPGRAASHLARKLRFAGRRVQTVRDFVKGIATKSEETGRPYEIRWPNGKTQPLAEWLSKRLVLYEKGQTPGIRPPTPVP